MLLKLITLGCQYKNEGLAKIRILMKFQFHDYCLQILW